MGLFWYDNYVIIEDRKKLVIDGGKEDNAFIIDRRNGLDRGCYRKYVLR